MENTNHDKVIVENGYPTILMPYLLSILLFENTKLKIIEAYSDCFRTGSSLARRYLCVSYSIVFVRLRKAFHAQTYIKVLELQWIVIPASIVHR
jgi:hypothetical protein